MPQDEGIGAGAGYPGRRLRIYTYLCQLIIAIITFYCAIAITRYSPKRDLTPTLAVIRAFTSRPPLSSTNSTTSYICKTGTREDTAELKAVLVAITPHSVLCPTTSSFFLYLFSFVFGIFIFNSLHTEDLDLTDGYSYFIITGLLSVDRQNVLASLQAIMPMVIWSATVLLPFAHWFFKKVSPGMYGSYRRMRKLQVKEFWEILGRGERVSDVEVGGNVAEGIDEETPLRRDEERTVLHAQRLTIE